MLAVLYHIEYYSLTHVLVKLIYVNKIHNQFIKHTLIY